MKSMHGGVIHVIGARLFATDILTVKDSIEKLLQRPAELKPHIVAKPAEARIYLLEYLHEKPKFTFAQQTTVQLISERPYA